MLIYYRIIPWIIQYEFVLDSRMHLHLWDRRAGDTFWSTDVSAFDFWEILQMLSRHLVYLHLSSLTSADAFQTGGHINLHLHLLFFCFADTFPVSGVSYLAFILSCRCFPGIWCILSCFSFVLQMLSRYLLYLHLSSGGADCHPKRPSVPCSAVSVWHNRRSAKDKLTGRKTTRYN